MKKSKLFYLIRLVIVTLIYGGMTVLGALVFVRSSEPVRELLSTLSFVVFCLLALLYFGSYGASRLYIKKKSSNINARERDRYLTARAEVIRSDYLKAKRKLAALRVSIVIYVIFIGLLLAVSAFLSLFTNIVFSVVIIFIAFGIACRIGAADDIDLSHYSKPSDYPAVYEIANNAARTMGIEGEIRIDFIGQGSAGVARFGKTISLQLNPIMLSYLREEELYTVILHEMAHIKNTEADLASENTFSAFLYGGENEMFFAKVGAFAFSFFSALYSYESGIYKYLSSVVVEKLADRAMAEYGNRSDAANALYKIHCYALFDKDINRNMDRLFYETEECISDMMSLISQSFISKIPEKEGTWRHIAGVEIQPRGASHPILRSRIEEIGASEYRFSEPRTEGAYYEETVRALKALDAEVEKNLSESWAEQREHFYLKPLETVKRWEERGRDYEPEQAREIMDALLGLQREDDALSFCDHLVENERGGLRDYAKFVRGGILLARYDDRGLDDLYDAVEGNDNYVDEGLEQIGDYCCLMGLQEKLEEFRERRLEYLQKHIDIEGYADLGEKDELSRETEMPAEIFERNLEFIKRVGGEAISRIFLVRKQVTADFSSSVYVIEFANETENEEARRIYNMIFEHLDNDPDDWQYALSTYDPGAEQALKKVPDCCIYNNK